MTVEARHASDFRKSLYVRMGLLRLRSALCFLLFFVTRGDEFLCFLLGCACAVSQWHWPGSRRCVEV